MSDFATPNRCRPLVFGAMDDDRHDLVSGQNVTLPTGAHRVQALVTWVDEEGT